MRYLFRLALLLTAILPLVVGQADAADVYTFATLPGAPSAGDLAWITDGSGTEVVGEPAAGAGSAMHMVAYDASQTRWEFVMLGAPTSPPTTLAETYLDANQVAFDPAGTAFTAINVQDALEEASTVGALTSSGGVMTPATDTDDLALGVDLGGGVRPLYFDQSAAALSLNRPGASIYLAPAAATGQESKLFEGSNNGSNYFGFTMPAALDADAVCTLAQNGTWSGNCPGSGGVSDSAYGAGVHAWHEATTIGEPQYRTMSLGLNAQDSPGFMSTGIITAAANDEISLWTVLVPTNAYPGDVRVFGASTVSVQRLGTASALTVTPHLRRVVAGCTGPLFPWSCCTGHNAGDCTPYSYQDHLCTAASTPWACCTGAGTGTCPSSSEFDLLQLRDPEFSTAGASDFTLIPVNGECTASEAPWPCCTGSGTGTCNTDEETFIRIDTAGDYLVQYSIGITFDEATAP